MSDLNDVIAARQADLRSAAEREARLRQRELAEHDRRGKARDLAWNEVKRLAAECAARLEAASVRTTIIYRGRRASALGNPVVADLGERGWVLHRSRFKTALGLLSDGHFFIAEESHDPRYPGVVLTSAAVGSELVEPPRLDRHAFHCGLSFDGREIVWDEEDAFERIHSRPLREMVIDHTAAALMAR